MASPLALRLQAAAMRSILAAEEGACPETASLSLWSLSQKTPTIKPCALLRRRHKLLTAEEQG